MPVVQSEIVVHGNCESLYKATQDYTKRLDWDPFLKEARLIDGFSEVKIGARAWCVAKMGIGMETKYVFVQEPHVVAVKMTKGPSILKSFAGSWRFIEQDKFRTKIVFRYFFSCTYPIMQRPLAYLLNYEMRKRLIALKKNYEGNNVIL